MENQSDEKHDSKKEHISGKTSILNRLGVGLVGLAIVWFLFGGRISYAVSECSNGVGRCVIGIVVALGIVDVYDKNNRCTGMGCNY